MFHSRSFAIVESVAGTFWKSHKRQRRGKNVRWGLPRPSLYVGSERFRCVRQGVFKILQLERL